MIKGKATYPFDTIALAVAFSPRLEGLVAETKRLSEVHNARTIFIHVGKKTSEKQRQLSGVLTQHGFNDSNSLVVWEQGTPVDGILSVCKQEVVDLLILGALDKENILKYYMGSISREISRRAKCSVLLFINPSPTPKPLKKIVVNGHDHPKTMNTLRTALYFAEREKSDTITIVNEVDIPTLSMSMADDSPEPEGNQIREDFLAAENKRLEALVAQIPNGPVKIHNQVISGRSGHTISKFAQEEQADLLVVNSPDHSLSIFDRIFTHDIEYMLEDMPCNMLIVHTRISE